MSIHIPFQYFISTLSVCSATGQTHELLWVREPWAPAGFSSHIISLLAVGKAHIWTCGAKVLQLSGSGGELAICHQSSELGVLRRWDLLFQLIFACQSISAELHLRDTSLLQHQNGFYFLSPERLRYLMPNLACSVPRCC